MFVRIHNTEEIQSEAVYSDCGAYRYQLRRTWSPEGKKVNFIMLNPSVADEVRNDPTVARCEARARALGFGAFSVTNIFAWRDTDPAQLRKVGEPVGPDNDKTLLTVAGWADTVIAAWGVHGAHLDRGRTVVEMLRGAGIGLHHMGLTKQGHPRHPLYLPYTAQPELWDVASGS
ncbi:DUF1643 domain-containing protein [uncultured Roseobacter sp.]|uniref:DUF1643 domain-containing protein n=1 Tax=uncultured Roseobacter sp. TaxID=114847 RepID=UPI002629BF1E|nr:DUF1643 domain-containing protein [uncultured Roseobacter sp.]